MFDDQLLVRSGIQTEVIRGDTPSERSNGLHVDAVNLTARGLGIMATAMFQTATVDRFSKLTIKSLILQGIENGDIDRARVNQGVLKEIESRP